MDCNVHAFCYVYFMLHKLMLSELGCIKGWSSCTAGDSVGQFSGVLDCFTKTFRNEGLLAFYNGFGPNFARLGSWNVVMFLTVEQVKKLFIPKDAL